jgi:tetratricopeptide (TPR) repeat protein
MKEFRPKKFFSRRRKILQTVTSLGYPIEASTTAPGVTLVTAEIVEIILTDRRKWDLVHPFKMAVLKNYSQEAARLMSMGLYDKALPIALDAVKKGQAIFKPGPSFQMFPLFLLAAQANLGLKQADQCENFLGLAAWLLMKETHDTTNMMRAQLCRLYGQLYALQGKHVQALQSFAEDVYYCSLEYGTQDVRTSLGFYNLGKVFESKGEQEKCGRCCEQVLDIWLNALINAVLSDSDKDKSRQMPISEAQLAEVIEMLHDILDIFTKRNGPNHDRNADIHFSLGLAFMHLGDNSAAYRSISAAKSGFSRYPEKMTHYYESLSKLGIPDLSM